MAKKTMNEFQKVYCVYTLEPTHIIAIHDNFESAKLEVKKWKKIFVDEYVSIQEVSFHKTSKTK